MSLMTHFGFLIYYRTSEILGWRIGVHYRGRFIRYTKVVEHVMFDELDQVWCFYFLLANNFHPFREVIRYAQDKAMSFRHWRTDGSNNIHSPRLEWPWGGRWMKMSCCLMDEVTVDLTCMASLSIGDGIRDHLRPVIAKYSKPVSKFVSRLWALHILSWASLSASCASLCERYRSRIPSYDRWYNVCMIAL